MTPATPPTARGQSERLLAFTWVGALPLALDGARIVSIDTASEGDEGVDVFDLFGVACPFLRSERRLARLSAEGDSEREGEERRALLLGDRVELGAVGANEVLALPSFLAGLRAHSGLVGFVRFSGTLFSLFDPTRVTKPRDLPLVNPT